MSKVVCGVFVLNDAPQSERPVKIDSNQIKTLLENDCYNVEDSNHIQNIKIKN